MILKAWRTPGPQDTNAPTLVELRIESYRLEVMSGNASGMLNVVPIRQPLLIGSEPGRFGRLEIYTDAEVLRETVLIEGGRLIRIPAPLYKVWVEHLAQLGRREGYEIEAQSAVFDPMTIAGEGVARLQRPNYELRVAADAIRLVRITAPDGTQSTMEYANACVTIR